MALAYEKNLDLAVDTTLLREYATRYGRIAGDLREMASKLDSCLNELKSNGWTTPAGTAFHKMTNTDWNQNIEKYADLLETLQNILQQAAGEYEVMISAHIEKTRL